MKKCRVCGEEKSLEFFSKDTAKKDGLRSLCKPCDVKKVTANQAKNMDRTKQRRAERYQNNKEKMISQQQARYIKYLERHLVYAAKQRAKRFNVPFNLKEEDIVIPEYCPILGIKLQPRSIDSNRDGSPSIDRVRPELGYFKDNVVVMSYRANRIKNNGTAEEHRKIADWMESKICNSIQPMIQ